MEFNSIYFFAISFIILFYSIFQDRIASNDMAEDDPYGFASL